MTPPVHAHATFDSAERVVSLARRLQAQGYPLEWQSARVGADVEHLVESAAPLLVEVSIVRALDRLARTVGEAVATPNKDLTPESITEAKHAARAAGYYPPAAYDEDGTLVPGAVEGHPWDEADALAERRLRILELRMAGATNLTIAEAVGIARPTVDRATALINPLLVDADWRDEARRALALHAHHEENPTALALHLGILAENAVVASHPAHERARTLATGLGPVQFAPHQYDAAA